MPLAHLKLVLFTILFLDILMNCFLLKMNRIQRNERLKILLGTPNHPQKESRWRICPAYFCNIPQTISIHDKRGSFRGWQPSLAYTHSSSLISFGDNFHPDLGDFLKTRNLADSQEETEKYTLFAVGNLRCQISFLPKSCVRWLSFFPANQPFWK